MNVEAQIPMFPRIPHIFMAELTDPFRKSLTHPPRPRLASCAPSFLVGVQVRVDVPNVSGRTKLLRRTNSLH